MKPPLASLHLLNKKICDLRLLYNLLKSPIMIKIASLAVLLLALLLVSPTALAEEAKPFVHPGMLHSKSELAFIKGKISSGAEPWKSAWEQLRATEEA